MLVHGAEAVLLILGPIFEVDRLPREYGSRSGLDAKMAIRAIHFGIAQRGKREVVNYADGLVILCPNGRGEETMAAMRHLMSRLGLMVNEKKT